MYNLYKYMNDYDTLNKYAKEFRPKVNEFYKKLLDKLYDYIDSSYTAHTAFESTEKDFHCYMSIKYDNDRSESAWKWVNLFKADIIYHKTKNGYRPVLSISIPKSVQIISDYDYVNGIRKVIHYTATSGFSSENKNNKFIFEYENIDEIDVDLILRKMLKICHQTDKIANRIKRNELKQKILNICKENIK